MSVYKKDTSYEKWIEKRGINEPDYLKQLKILGEKYPIISSRPRPNIFLVGQEAVYHRKPDIIRFIDYVIVDKQKDNISKLIGEEIIEIDKKNNTQIEVVGEYITDKKGIERIISVTQERIIDPYKDLDGTLVPVANPNYVDEIRKNANPEGETCAEFYSRMGRSNSEGNNPNYEEIVDNIKNGLPYDNKNNDRSTTR